MQIREVQISKAVQYKILLKHRVKFDEIKQVLLNHALIRKTKDGKYIAISYVQRYITVIFAFENGIVDIITAYPSSEWQIKLYKKKK